MGAYLCVRKWTVWISSFFVWKEMESLKQEGMGA